MRIFDRLMYCLDPRHLSPWPRRKECRRSSAPPRPARAEGEPRAPTPTQILRIK